MEWAELTCVSLLTYCPRDGTAEAERSRDIKTALKTGKVGGDPPTSMCRQIAGFIRSHLDLPPLYAAFASRPVLVPTPKSSLTRAGDLWVPLQLAQELVAAGLGSRVAAILTRSEAIPKSAISPPSERPTASRHFETLAVQAELGAVDSFLLIDDVVTRGATLLGAAHRLRTSFPAIPVQAFAAIRTVSNPSEFQRITNPAVETIWRRTDGSTLRRPSA